MRLNVTNSILEIINNEPINQTNYIDDQCYM